MVAVVVEEQREREGSGRVWPRATPSSSTPSKNDKGKGFLNPWTPERDPQQILSSSWSVCKRNKRGREEICKG
jgi:hypothetical protein